ncbi:MAG: ABC transporter permease [Clostridia bacterium]|nr:ABC transporter permease [Clostridia bacterium]
MNGVIAVTRKELADHFGSLRFLILLGLIALSGLTALYLAAQTIRANAADASSTGFVFLLLFTSSGSSLPPFTALLGFLGPLVGLALGFDAISSERARGTLSRLVAQPIHRDAIINGKFLAGLTTLVVMFTSILALVGGLGLILTGVAPTSEEIARLIAFLVVTVLYVAFWLGLAILFSVVFRSAATSALTGVALWLFFSVFLGLLAGMVADAVAPAGDNPTIAEALRHAYWEQDLSRLSPTTLYSEAVSALLSPAVRTVGPIVITQTIGMVPGKLSFGQSLLLIWPQVAGLLAATALCFGLAYVYFMRQEVRA